MHEGMKLDLKHGARRSFVFGTRNLQWEKVGGNAEFVAHKSVGSNERADTSDSQSQVAMKGLKKSN